MIPSCALCRSPLTTCCADGNLIGHDLAEVIFDELTIQNTAKDVAKRRTAGDGRSYQMTSN
jgi:hypothetical protein